VIPVPGNPDPDLLRRARLGEHAAFAELHERYAPAVRALIEARRPGSSRIDEWSVGAFELIFSRLGLLQDAHWLHREFIRQTREYLDGQQLRPEDPGEDAPDWLKQMPIEPRELLFFATRAEALCPFPGYEYFGITQQAYEARLERATQARQERINTGLPAALPEAAPTDWRERQWTQIRESLSPQADPRSARRWPRLPLPLAFLLVVGAAMLGLSLVFMSAERDRPVAQFAASTMRGPSSSEPLHKVEFELLPESILQHRAVTVFELERGSVRIRHNGSERVRILLAGRELALSRGTYELRLGDGGAWIQSQDGNCLLSWTDQEGQAREKRLLDGELSW
jgi:hypothetical protein